MDQPFTEPVARTHRPARHLVATLLLAVVMIAAVPGLALAADPATGRGTPTGTLARVPTGVRAPTAALIYRSTAMARQYTNYWCVPATTQSMLNLILGTSDRTKATQERYYKGTRQHNRYSYKTKGNDPQGWAWALRYYSGGQTTYQDRAFTNKDAAIAAIAESIDRTGDPVGVLVHNGTHAWIALGYKAQRDPLDPSKRTLLGFYVNGPLGPGSSDPWPYEYMPMAEFRSHFSKYHEWQFPVVWEGRWVIVSQ